MTTASMNFKTDRTTKEKFNQVAKKLGLTTSSLLNLFVTRVAREQAVPFDVKVVPDKEELDLDEESKKEMIDDMHKRKIDMSDEIFVINKNGYIGTSTKSEIEYAIKTGKKVNYMEK